MPILKLESESEMSPADGKIPSPAPQTEIAVSELSALEVFVAQHRNQLETSVVPSHLWNALFNKLSQNVSDIYMYGSSVVYMVYVL